MTKTTLNIQELKSIVEWVKLTDDVREISLKYGDVELFMSRNENTAASPAAPTAVTTADKTETVPSDVPVAPQAVTPQVEPSSADHNAAVEPAADEVIIKAPMVGIFYEAPRPGAPAFVETGDAVKEDTVLGIVEVMKLMNNIEAKVEGTVERILVQNGDAVEYGQPLMVIRRNA